MYNINMCKSYTSMCKTKKLNDNDPRTMHLSPMKEMTGYQVLLKLLIYFIGASESTCKVAHEEENHNKLNKFYNCIVYRI